MVLDVARIQALCFDVDGTLSDTDDLLVARLARWLEHVRFLFPRRDPLRLARRLIMVSEAPANFLIGLPDHLGLDDELFALADWLARFSKKPKQFLLINGVREMLAALASRYPLAVVSARDERTTRLFLAQFDLLPFFRCVATATTCKHTKPYPDPILWAAAQMGVSPASCLMIGDTTVDIRAGRAAGAQTAGVLCGFGERAELERCGADVILETTPDLLSVLSHV
jgi:HAD superfamily hydrolase (TIGR01549 family)